MQLLLQLLTLLGSVALFLFGLNLLSGGLQKVAGDGLRSFLASMTSNRFKQIMTGIGVTAVIQSSTATTIMVVSFVNAGLLVLGQAIGVIMGAHIGTTITSWIMAVFGFSFNMADFAFPMILFGFDLRSVRSLAREFLIGYGLQIVSAIVVACAAGVIAYRSGLAAAPQLSGMAIGLYSGGTPNLIAIGNALVPAGNAPAVIIAANTSDALVGGLYFLLILTAVRPIYNRFLGRSAMKQAVDPIGGRQVVTAQGEYDFRSIPRDRRSMMRLAGVTGLAVLCLALGAGLELLINGSLDGSLYIMITVSVLGIVISFIKPVRDVRGSYQIGQYLVLAFSLGLSMSIDFSALVQEIVPTLVYFACVQVICTVLHLLLCRLFRLDGGTALITNVAGIYGPPFIAPVAEAYGDRRLIAPGVICGITGLVIGNLLGIGIGSVLALLLA